MLMEEMDVSSFTIKLQLIMSATYSSYPKFHEYFKREYVSKVEQWATCHRSGTPVNTNMHLESFRLLKIVYFDSKYNRCVDHLIHMLLKLSRNLVFERIIKLEKGKITHRKREILQRHKKTALKVASVCPVQTENP